MSSIVNINRFVLQGSEDFTWRVTDCEELVGVLEISIVHVVVSRQFFTGKDMKICFGIEINKLLIDRKFKQLNCINKKRDTNTALFGSLTNKIC